MKTRIKRLPPSVCGLRSYRRAGFTMIEMLIVVAIILILSGIAFRLAAVLGGRGTKAEGLAQMANLEHALNEYFAEYGIYPPVNSTRYEYENKDWHSDVMLDPGFTNHPDAFHYGLYAHLWHRHKDDGGPANPNMGDSKNPRAIGPAPGWNPDTDRDKEAKRRWAHYLEGVEPIGGTIPVSNDIGTVILVYSNGYSDIVDAWGSSYRYESRPPYLSYTLTSPNLD